MNFFYVATSHGRSLFYLAIFTSMLNYNLVLLFLHTRWRNLSFFLIMSNHTRLLPFHRFRVEPHFSFLVSIQLSPAGPSSSHHCSRLRWGANFSLGLFRSSCGDFLPRLFAVSLSVHQHSHHSRHYIFTRKRRQDREVNPRPLEWQASMLIARPCHSIFYLQFN